MNNATQTRLNFLPEHDTDFVFASYSEQRGFVGASLLLALYLLVLWRGLRVVTVARDLYSAIVAGGIVVALLFQIFVNVGMTMGIAPITGIPLPFVSVGGSSMIANLAAMGVLLAIYARGRAARSPAPLMKAPVSIGAVREARSRSSRRRRSDARPLVVGGARELAAVLAPRAGAGRAARRRARRRRPEGAAVFVYVLGREPTEDDEAALKRARRARVPIVAVAVGRRSRTISLPFVLATDIVRVGGGRGLPDRRDRARDRRAARRGRRAARGAACRCYAARSATRIVASFARKNAARRRARSSSPAPTCRCSRSTRSGCSCGSSQAYGLETEPRERLPEIARRPSAPASASAPSRASCSTSSR